jgi:hypothetical protein
MRKTAIDTLTRYAAGAMSRRGSLRLLGGAGLASVLATPVAARPGKGRKNARRRCTRQKAQCLAFFKAYCAPLEEPQACEASWVPCCESFAACRAGAGIACIFNAE